MSPREHTQLALWRRDYRDGRLQEENPHVVMAQVTPEATRANQDHINEPGRREGTLPSPRNAQVTVDLEPTVDDNY